MNILYNQPIRFWPSGQRNTNMPLVALDDTEYQFQIQTTDIYGEYSNWAQNGDFSSSTGWTLSGGMTISGGVLSGTIASGTGAATTDYVMRASGIFRITIVVNVNTGTFYLDQTDRYDFSGTGTYQIIMRSFPRQKLKMRFENGTFEIDSVKIEDVTDNYKFKAILTEVDGTFVNAISLNTRNRTFATYDLPFSSYSISYDKYVAKLLDPLTNNGSQCLVKNGYFSNKEDSASFIWELTGENIGTFEVKQNATFDYHQIEWRTVGSTTGDNIEQQSILNDGVEYTVTFKIESITTATVTVYVGTNSTSFTTTGNKSTTLTCTGNTNLKFKFTDNSGSGEAIVSQIEIAMTDEANYVPDYESNIFDYKSSDCNNLEVRAVFNKDCLGLGSGAEFIPTALYPIKLRDAEYEDEDLRYTDSSGKRSIYFFEQRKNKTVESEIMAEYMHDFLAQLKGFDNFYIGQKEYTVEDTYQVEYVTDDYGIGQFKVGERTQNRIARKKSISSVGIDVSSTGSYLVDPNGNYIVDPSGNNIVTP